MKRVPLIPAIVFCAFTLAGCNAKKEEPKDIGNQAQVTAAHDLINATRAANEPFLSTHGIIRDNLAALENACINLTQAPDNPQLKRIFGTALDQAVERANIIAKRQSETAADKKIASELREKLAGIRKL